METITNLKQAKIVDLITVTLDDILLELYFNIEQYNERFSFKLSISDDGETILFGENKKWVELSDINYEAYSIAKVDNYIDELSKLLYKEISFIQFGIGKKLDTKKDVIYYILINTNKNRFLFFNNGDEGAYSFDNIESILENDIYGYEWVSKPPIESTN